MKKESAFEPLREEFEILDAKSDEQLLDYFQDIWNSGKGNTLDAIRWGAKDLGFKRIYKLSKSYSESITLDQHLEMIYSKLIDPQP